MQTRHTWLSAQIFPCQFEQIFKNARLSFLLVHLDLCAHIHTLYPLTQGETEHHTFSTVPAMMLFPSGIRMPPRMATTAPNTAPAISPHLLLKQPMVECFSLRLRPYVCLSAWQPVLLLSLCVCGVCCYVQPLCVCVPAAAAAKAGCTIRGDKGAGEARYRHRHLSQSHRHLL